MSTGDARPVHYAPASEDALFECFPIQDLRNRVGRARLGELERLHFDMIVACTAGTGRHEVDFEITELTRNRWLHIRPGQVHRWLPGTYDANLILLSPIDRSPHWRPGPRIIELTDDDLHDLGPLVGLLGHPWRTDIGGAALETIRHLVVRWLALDRPDDGDAEPLYTDFRRLLDVEVARSRNVERYASRLGCSTRTLARACQRAAGRSPKELIDDATVLEARRLLALPNATVTGVAATLGFDELTNFTKFFKRVSGDTPSEWQHKRKMTNTGPTGGSPQTPARA